MAVEGEGFSAALKLFQERSIAQVKDYDLELGSKVARSQERFTRELQAHYKDILKVTDEVDRLYSGLKEGDALFMDLCFKDEAYKLNKLPDFQDEGYGSAGRPSETSIVDEGISRTLLVVSSWVLAISDLISRFATSHAASKLFDSVMHEFSELQKVLLEATGYEDVIRARCEAFLQFVCSPDIHLTLIQLVRIHNLVLGDGQEVFPWKKETLCRFEQLLFEAVFREDLDSILENDDKLISSFVGTKRFKDALNKKLLEDSQALFERLDELANSNDPDPPILALHDARLTEFNIPEVVEESQFYSMGLDTRRKVHWYKIITPLTGIIDKLEYHGGCSQAQGLRQKLVEKLQQQKSVIQTFQDEEPASMDDVVSRLIKKQNETKFASLLETKIQFLTVPSSPT